MNQLTKVSSVHSSGPRVRHTRSANCLTPPWGFYVDQLIDIKVLTIKKMYHVEKLLSKFPWGIIFKFEDELTKWQTNGSITSNDHNNITNLGEIVLCSSSKPIVEDSQKSPNIKYQLKANELLNSTTQGPLILNYYEKNSKLNDGIRLTLVDILIGHELSQKIAMSVTIAESIADQVVVMFKSEVKVIIRIDSL